MTGWLATLAIHAENVVRLSSVSGAPGEEVTVDVSITNSDAVAAIQLEIPLDESLTVVEGSAQTASRASAHSATVGAKDGVMTLMVYSLSMSAITGNSGEVASFRLKLGNQPKDIVLQPTSLKLTSLDGTELSSSASSGTVSIRCAKAAYSSMTVDFGHVPIRDTYTQNLTVRNTGNEPLTVTGLAFLDPTFSSSQPLPFTVSAGGSKTIAINYAPVERGAVESDLIVTCNSISKLNTIKLKADPFAVNEVHVMPTSGVSDEEVTVSIRVNNMDDITGFQFEIPMPNELKYVDGSFALSDRKQDHIAQATYSGGVLRALCYSSNNKAFTGNDGVIATFKVKLNGRYGANLNLSKAVLTAQIKGQTTNVTSAFDGAYITIQSPRISTSTSINMGSVPVTEDCKYTLNVRNYGNAPLTISRIVFDNESLTVEETMPMTIEANSSKSLTVVYNSTTQGDFSGIMQIYCNDPDSRLVNVNLVGSRFAPNYMEFTADDVFILDEQQIAVTLDNYDNINGFQFDVSIPTRKVNKTTMTVYQPSDVVFTPAEGVQGLNVECRSIDSQTYRYFCFFLDGSTVQQGKSTVMQLNFTPTEALELGTCTFTVSNIKLSTPDFVDKYAGTGTIPVAFNVVKKTQEIALEELPAMTYGDDAYSLPEKTTDGQDIVWTTGNTGVAAISGNMLSIQKAGTAVVKATQAGNELYLPLTKEYTLTVEKAMLTVTAQDCTRTEGEANPPLTFNYDGFKYQDEASSLKKEPRIATTAKAESPAGTYPITLSGGESDCYEFNYVDGTLTVVAKTAQTIALTELPEMTYGDAAYTLPEKTAEGFPLTWTSGNPEVAAINGNQLSILKAGNAEVTVNQAGDSIYQAFTKTFELTVKKALLTVTAQDCARTEGEANPPLTFGYDGFKFEDNESVLTKQPKASTTANKDSKAGEYAITLSGGESDRYEFNYMNGTLTVIAKTEQTIALTELPEMTYGDAAYTLPEKTAEGFPLTWTVSNPELAAINGNQLSILKAGNAEVTVTQAGDSIYQAFTKTFELTVKKALLTVTAENCERAAGEENPEFTLTYEGFVKGEDKDVLTKQPTATTTATVASIAGEYPITPSGGSAVNYEFQYVEGVLTVVKADQSVSIAELPTMTYGDAAYTLPAETDKGQSLTWTSDNTGVATISDNQLSVTGAGTATITVTQAGDDSHNPFSQTFTLTVGKAQLTITADDQTKTAGEENPELTVRYEGFVNGDDESVLTEKPTISCEADKQSRAGEYAITLTGGKSDNYELTLVDGVLTVNEPPHLRGDVNEDGRVDISDIVADINQMAGHASWRYADVNEDNSVNISDIVAIINIMAGNN